MDKNKWTLFADSTLSRPAYLQRISCARLFVATIGLGCAAASSQTFAQSTKDDGIQEVVVTANKRSQNINDVGSTVAALSGDFLNDQHVTSLADLASAIPGLSYTPSLGATPVYTLRGIGFFESSLAVYPSVSAYVDQIPLPFPAMTGHTLFDLDRVEVLKGPQGTLFGENATGGAINFIAAKPTASFDTGADLTYGSYNRAEGTAFISDSLTDTLRARLAINGARADGWQQSDTRPGDTNGAVDYYASRLLVDWDATDTISVEASLNGFQDRSQPQAPQYESIFPNVPLLPANLLHTQFANQNATSADWDPAHQPFANNTLVQGSVRVDMKLTPDLTLTDLSSYGIYSQYMGINRSGVDYETSNIQRSAGIIKVANEELRLANADNNVTRWIVGGNYEHSDISEFQLLNLSNVSLAYAFHSAGNLYNATTSVQALRNYAGFANAEHDLLDDVTLKGGIRYTATNRDATDCTFDPTGPTGGFATAILNQSQRVQTGAVAAGGITPPTGITPKIGPNGCVQLQNIALNGSPITYLPGEFHDQLNETNVSWHTGVDYKLEKGVLLYADISRGYKAGSIPLAASFTWSQDLPVPQERLLDYEVGYKVQGLDQHLLWTGAAFYYDYTNKQERSKTLTILGPLDALQSIPKSYEEGLETSITYIPITGLKLGLSETYLYSDITNYTGFSTTGQVTNFNGARLPYAPRFNTSASVDYSWEFDRYQPFVGITIESRTDAMANIGGTKGAVPTAQYASSVPLADTFLIPGYTTIDLRAGIDMGNWKIMAYGKNVTNKYYWNNVVENFETVGRYAAMPATWGLTFTYRQ